MSNPRSQYIVDVAAATVTHKDSGIVIRFAVHPDGGWVGAAIQDTIPPGLTSQYISTLASQMGDAWAKQKSECGK